MTTQEARKAAKAQLSRYLETAHGIANPRKPFRCLNPEHEDLHPSMSLDEHRNRVKCFACGVSYDIFDLVQMDYKLSDIKSVFAKTYALLGLSVGETEPIPFSTGKIPPTSCLEACQHRTAMTDYLQKRGISASTAAAADLGFDPAFKTRAEDGRLVSWAALIIPTGPDRYVFRNTDESAGKGDRIRKRGAGSLYRLERLWDSQQPMFVVEGEMDALSVLEVGGEALALGSTANASALLEVLSLQVKPGVPLLLALDADDAGRKAEQVLLAGLETLGIAAYSVDLCGGWKDPNEALVADREAFKGLVRAAEAVPGSLAQEQRDVYRQTCAAGHLRAFVDGIAQNVDTSAVPTGFTRLDDQLDGGLFEGLYILGAVTSLGKTSFAMQVADQIAAQRRDVLIISLEMARTELMARSISRITLQSCLERGVEIRNAKTVRGITDGGRYAGYSDLERALISDAVDRYEEYAGHVFIHEGIGDIGVSKVRQIVARHVDCTGVRPVLVVDYLQILAPFSERASDKQNIDKAVLELKRISRDFKIPVIGVSSFNRQNYQSTVRVESFKESGAIEYSSDVLMGLQFKGAGLDGFDMGEEQRRNPRQIELRVLKNRNGAVGAVIGYKYFPMYNYFVEEDMERMSGRRPGTRLRGAGFGAPVLRG